jgi:hypothetical protein
MAYQLCQWCGWPTAGRLPLGCFRCVGTEVSRVAALASVDDIEASRLRAHQELHRARHHPARGERILSKPRRPISETNLPLLAREARTAQQMWGDGEAEAEHEIWVNCDLYGNRLRAGGRWDVCEQTPECRREHLRPPAR